MPGAGIATLWERWEATWAEPPLDGVGGEAVPVQVRPRPTCKESDEARLERLASCGPRAAGGLALGAVSGRQY